MHHLGKAALAAAAVAWAGAAGAAPITGSLSFSDGANETGQSLLTRTSFTVLNATTQGGTNDFSTVPVDLPVTIGTFTLPGDGTPSTAVGPTDFQFSFLGGSFVATSAQETDQSIAPSGNESITALFLGTFTPADGLSGFDPSAGSVIANLNRSGSAGNFSVASAFTLAVPPAAGVSVPEPASMALLGIGLAALCMMRRRAG